MTAGLWTAFEAAAATGGALCARGGDPDRWIAEEWAAGGLSIDTRTLAPGEMFVALSDARDGHEFINSAFERGASAALVARAPENAPDGAPLLIVRDTLEGLRDLARAARLRNFGKRIAVTGSVGKTSTKEMLRAAFSGLGRVHASDKSFNNHWGVPLTLARMPIDSDFGIFEIGMNHAGEITPLTRLVAPHVAIVTTVAPRRKRNFLWAPPPAAPRFCRSTTPIIRSCANALRKPASRAFSALAKAKTRMSGSPPIAAMARGRKFQRRSSARRWNLLSMRRAGIRR
mgnify:CR=1 FL=1